MPARQGDLIFPKVKNILPKFDKETRAASSGRKPISSAYARKARGFGADDEVGGTIGPAGQFAKRDGGLRSLRFPEKEKGNPEKEKPRSKNKKDTAEKNPQLATGPRRKATRLGTVKRGLAE